MNSLLNRIDYRAPGGEEIFLSYEGKNSGTLHGFLRLRIPSGKEHRPEIRDAKDLACPRTPRVRAGSSRRRAL